MNEARHVCLCADDAFAVPLAATLKSIERSQPDPTHLAVTVLGLGLTSRSADLLRRSVPQLDLRFRDVESQLPSDLPEDAGAPHPRRVRPARCTRTARRGAVRLSRRGPDRE